MPTLGTTELIILLVIVLILFGGSRIGELGGALGRGIREFKTSVRDEDAAGKQVDEPEEAKTAAAGPAEKTTATAAAGPAEKTTVSAAAPTENKTAAAPSAPTADGAKDPAKNNVEETKAAAAAADASRPDR